MYGMNGYTMPNYQAQFQCNPQALTRVNGIDGAKAYQIGANSTVALFDSNSDVFYVKSTDGAGFPTIRVFRFEEIAGNQGNNGDYITRKEMEDYVEQFIPRSTTKQADASSQSATASNA